MKPRWSAAMALWLAALLSTTAWAKTYYVDKAHPSAANDINHGSMTLPWLTIQYAASRLQAGDTCVVATGVYEESVSPANSGLNGSPITFAVKPGNTAVVRRFNLDNRSYIRIIGFEITHNSTTYEHGIMLDNAAHCEILNNTIHHVVQQAIRNNYTLSNNAYYNVVRGNTIYYTGCPTGVAGQCTGSSGQAINLHGSHNLFEYNDISHTGDDPFSTFGAYNIIRNNYFHDYADSDFPNRTPNEIHVDFWQPFSEDGNLTQWNIVENNFANDNKEMNSHLFQLRNSAGSFGMRDILIRGNVGVRFGSYVAQFGGVDNTRMYNNTFGDFFYNQNKENDVIDYSLEPRPPVPPLDPSINNQNFNNIYYRTSDSVTGKIIITGSGCDVTASNNACEQSGSHPSCVVTSGINFTDYANDDLHLQLSSNAINSGKAITTVTSPNGSSTSFAVADAGLFSWGYGITTGDSIKVGSGNAVIITNIDYPANTITVNSSISWTNGDPVILSHQATTPTIGAYEYKSDFSYGVTLEPPTIISAGVVRLTAAVVNPDNVRFVEFYIDGIPVVTVTSAPYIYDWAISDLGKTYTLTAKAYALFADKQVTKNSTIEYVPGLCLSSPTGGETWIQGFSHAIDWSSSGVTEPVTIELFKGTVSQWSVSKPVAEGSYTWQIPLNQAVGDDYSIKITAGAYADTSGAFIIAAPAAPIVQTLPAQSVTTSSASLRGTVHPMGLATTYSFEYGLTTAYGSETTEVTLTAGDVTTSVQASIAGLKASTMYHFRLTATNSEGTTEGNDVSFTTSGGGGGGGSGDSGGGGGGGGCFINTAVDGTFPGLQMLILLAAILGLIGFMIMRNVRFRLSWINKGVNRREMMKTINSILILLIGTAVLCLITVFPSYATVISADSCKQEDVQKAINKAQDGDTVLVPAGTCTYTSPADKVPAVSITNKAITLQGAGTDKTFIIDSCVGTWQRSPFWIDGVKGKPFRITEVTFIQGSVNVEGYGAINVLGTCDNWRIDHCKFTEYSKNVSIYTNGDTHGVVDHCDFVTGSVDNSQYKSFGIYGNKDASWKIPLSLGSVNAVYVEDCMINYKFFPTYCCSDVGIGGRAVFRYDAFFNTNLGSHGCESNPSSLIDYESYHNTFTLNTNSTWGYAMSFRGGAGVVFNNTVSGIYNYGRLVMLYNYNACHDYSPNGCVPCTGYPCKQQVGRAPDANGNEVLEPLYEWNNTFYGGNGDITLGDSTCDVSDYIQLNRDYYNDTPRPGYVPYPYPHPLTVHGEIGRLLNLHKTVAPGKVDLDWDVVSGATGYGISRDWAAVVPIIGTSYTDNDPVQVYIVYAYNSDGKIMAAEGVNSDEQAPSAPKNLHPTAVTSGSVTLAWDASIDNYGVMGYRVYQGDSPVSVANVSGLIATIFNLTPSASYSFKVAAYDAAGNESAKSAPVLVTTKAGFTISGKVTLNGVGLADVVMSGLPGVTKTNADGEYTATVDQNWNGTVIPGLSGYAFNPVNITYSDVTSNQTGNYMAVKNSGGGGNGDSGGGGGGGGGCFIAIASNGLNLPSVLLPLFLFFLGIGFVGWWWGKKSFSIRPNGAETLDLSGCSFCKNKSTKEKPMKTKSLFAVMFLFLFMLSLPAWAANHYVREGATGTNNGSDWTNAFTDLPATLVRGDIYYVADGNYCPNGYSFDDAIDGEKYIKVLKATAASHGTDIGWDNQYGDGQAAFTETIDIRTSYIVFDGVVGGTPVAGTIFPDPDGYGFRVKPNYIKGIPHTLILAPHSADIDYIQISHCALIQLGEAFDADANGEGLYGQDCIYVGGDYATDYYIISHNYITKGSASLRIFQSSYTIVENNFFADNWSSPSAHGEQAVIGSNSDDVIIRNNVFYHPLVFAIGVFLGGNERWQVYNNIVIGDGSALSAGFANADAGKIDYLWNCEFHHNVFYNIDFARPAIFIGKMTDVDSHKNYSYNNIFYKVKDSNLSQEGSSGTPGSMVHGYNSYYDCWGTMQPGSTDEVFNGIDPFVNSAQFDFRLKAPTQPGKVLPSPYDVDYAGIIRGLDGNWDRGAYEFAPGLYLSSPIGGETWVQGFSHAIKWNSSGVTEPVKIELYKGSTLDQVLAESVPVTSGTSTWHIPTNQAVDNDYSIKISAGSYSDTSKNFTIAAPAAPDVHTLAAQSITKSSALLRGTVNPMGLETTYYFEYGSTTAYGSETAEATLPAGDEIKTVQAAIAGLTASTTYYFRLVANNREGTTEGNVLTFTTSGGGGGSNGDSGGGGGGGCFIKIAQSHGKTGSWPESWGIWLLCMALWLGLSLRKNLALSRVFRKRGIRRIGYKKNKYIFSVLLVSYLIFSIPTYADVIKAKSCSQQDVQAAIDQAQDGDTVLVPEGTSVWITPGSMKPAVQIGKQTGWNPPTYESKQITLQGAGIDQTIIIDQTLQGYNESAILVFTLAGKPIRVTGFTINRPGQKAEKGSIGIGGNGRNWRIDHVKFINARYGNGIVTWGDSYGVIDHGEFDTDSNPGNFKAFSINGAGDASWQIPLSLGTADAVYIEDCVLNYYMKYRCLDADYGGRWVFRHNTVYNNTDVGTHGYDSSPRAQISGEIYDNTFLHNSSGEYYTLNPWRGGTGVIFNNTVQHTTGQWNSFISLYYYCACPGNGTCGHETCTSYPCQDQPGRGPDSDHDGIQDLEPIYEWNNTVDITGPHIVVADLCSEVHTFIQENRDYYINKPRPGYSPYAYPHPLTQVKMLKVTSPNGEESWVCGTLMTVAWLQDNLSEDLIIDLYKGGVWQRKMGTAPATDGLFSWTIPAELTPADDYKVRISQGVLWDESDETFSITTSCEQPQIADQPQSQSISQGQTASLWVGASGSYALHYQWYQGESGDTGTPLGKDLSFYVTPPTLADTTRYWVRVSNACGSIDSRTATVAVQGGTNGGEEASAGGGGGGCFMVTAAPSALRWKGTGIIAGLMFLSLLASWYGKRRKARQSGRFS